VRPMGRGRNKKVNIKSNQLTRLTLHVFLFKGWFGI
jgi:hypothetical protein